MCLHCYQSNDEDDDDEDDDDEDDDDDDDEDDDDVKIIIGDVNADPNAYRLENWKAMKYFYV